MTGAKVFIGSDHAGFSLKSLLQAEVPAVNWVDLGPSSIDSVDYPDFAKSVCEKIQSAPIDSGTKGILICGSGQGMAISANRFHGIRAALCWAPQVARLAREHNDANVLCLGARLLSPEESIAILKVFLETKFEGGRHQTRLNKIESNSRM